MTVALLLAGVLAAQVTATPRTIPEQWQTELDCLAAAVADSLQRPTSAESCMDRERQRFLRDLHLAMDWPHPLFREPLLRLIESEDPEIMVRAGQALLNYDDAELRARVEELDGDVRLVNGPCIECYQALGDIIARQLKIDRSAGEFKPSADETRPPDEVEFPLQLQGHMVVPRAVELLAAEDLSVRLQAFAWLAHHGIVLTTRPAEEAWAKLSDRAKKKLINPWYADTSRIGGDQLRAVLEQFLAGHQNTPLPDAVLMNLLDCLATLGSTKARAPLLRLLDEMMETERRGQPTSAPVSSTQPTRPASAQQDARGRLIQLFRMFEAIATEDDIPQALLWTRSPLPAIRRGGLYVLAKFDTPAACEPVLAFIEAGYDLDVGRYTLSLPDPLEVIRGREWSDSPLKWRYLRATLRLFEARIALHERPATKDVEFVLDCDFRTVNVVRTLEALAQTYQGFHGMTHPIGFNLKAARKTAENWTKWIAENTPAPSD